MKRETKIGLLALVTIAVFVVGYNFLKGRDLFSDSATYNIVYEDVDQLGVGDLVTLNGLRVGQVTRAVLNPENVKSILVSITVDEDLPIPKTARALIKQDGPLGGKFIALDFALPCGGADCAVDGDYLQAAQEGMLASLIGDPAQLREYTDIAREAAGPIIDSIGVRLDTSALGRTLANTEVATRNLATLTAQLDRLLARSNDNIVGTTANLQTITRALADDEQRIGSILANVDSATARFAAIDLQTTLDAANATLRDLRATLETSNGALASLGETTAKINRGEGALGKLVNEDDIYTRLDRTITNFDLLAQDFRLNPKRYVNVSVFGKKQKDYELPENDPAAGQLPVDD